MKCITLWQWYTQPNVQDLIPILIGMYMVKYGRHIRGPDVIGVDKIGNDQLRDMGTHAGHTERTYIPAFFFPFPFFSPVFTSTLRTRLTS